jgi:hypothetical protein
LSRRIIASGLADQQETLADEPSDEDEATLVVEVAGQV